MTSVVVGLLALIGALVGMLILIPFHVAAHAKLDDYEADGALDIWWCWGLVGIRVLPSSEIEITLAGHLIQRRPIELSGQKKEKPEKGRPDPRVFIEHRTTILHILNRFTAALEPDATIWGNVGLDRPEHTAYLNVFLNELDAALPGVLIDVSPNYIEPSVLLRGVIRAFIWPARLAAVAIALISERETRQLLQALR